MKRGPNGIQCRPYSTPHIFDCCITQSGSGEGGGIACEENSAPVIEDCVIF
jgi:hypothetical protein